MSTKKVEGIHYFKFSPTKPTENSQPALQNSNSNSQLAISSHGKSDQINLLKMSELPKNPERSEELAAREVVASSARVVDDLPDRNEEFRRRLENINRRRSVAANLNTDIPMPSVTLVQQPPSKPSPLKVAPPQ